MHAHVCAVQKWHMSFVIYNQSHFLKLKALDLYCIIERHVRYRKSLVRYTESQRKPNSTLGKGSSREGSEEGSKKGRWSAAPDEGRPLPHMQYEPH